MAVKRVLAVTLCVFLGSVEATETEIISSSDTDIAYNYLVAQTEGSCTATNDAVNVQISFSGWDESNSSAESCTPQETVKMVTAHLLSTEAACVTSISSGRRLQSWTLSGTDAVVTAGVKTDQFSSSSDVITALGLGAFGDGSSSTTANDYEVYLRSINNMYKTTVTAIEPVSTTTTTSVTTSTDGGGWPWWAWFLLMLLLCCLICIPLIFLLGCRKTTNKTTARYAPLAPLPLATVQVRTRPAPVATTSSLPMASVTVPVPMASVTVPVPMATATVPVGSLPMATATVPVGSLPVGAAPLGTGPPTTSFSSSTTGSMRPPRVF